MEISLQEWSFFGFGAYFWGMRDVYFSTAVLRLLRPPSPDDDIATSRLRRAAFAHIFRWLANLRCTAFETTCQLRLACQP